MILAALTALAVSLVNAQPQEDAAHHPFEEAPSTINMSVMAEPAFYSWSELSTSTSRADFAYFIQRSHVHLKIAEEPWAFNFRMDNISLIGGAGLPQPLTNISTRYQKPGPNVFVSQVYLGYEGHWGLRPFIFSAGSIPIGAGRGILLDDNGLGIFGLHAALNDLGPLNLEYYGGNTETSSSNNEKVAFNYVNISAKRMGRWALGFLSQIDKSPRTLNKGLVYGKDRRNYYSLNYEQKSKNFLFHSEIIRSEGGYSLAGTNPHEKIVTAAMAMLFEGAWKATLPRLEFLGPVDLSFIYVQGSGDKSYTNKDEAYFAPLAGRFDGAKRTGFGRLMGASAFDALASTTTWNGLPAGLTGVTVYGVSFKTSPFRILSLPINFGAATHTFRATQSTGLSKDLGAEWSIEASSELSERFRAKACLFHFTPGMAYKIENVRPEPIQGVQAAFSLSFE